MTDTTPQSSERDAADAHFKEPDNVQTDQSAPQATHIQAFPLKNADSPPQMTNDVETPPDTSPTTASEGEPQRTSNSSAPSHSAIPQGEDLPKKPNPGESPMPSSTAVSGGEQQPGPSYNAFDEQSGMQVDTPTLPSKPLTDDLHNADRELHSPSIPRPETQEFNLDLLPRIPRLFRLLDLVSDRNIEKIIIDHDSMGAAMNTLRDGTYKTISKINFAALDGVSINPVGLYGSKSALTQTLVTLEAVDESIAEHLRQPINRNGQLSPYLRSGIYVFLPPVSTSDAQKPSSVVIYIIYWPEDETWNDDAPPTAQKNRVTFMRYLTKLAQDIRPLVSEEHAAAFVWKYDDENPRSTADSDSNTDDESDDDDRFVKFEVKKSGQEDEGVQQYPGFTVIHPFLRYCDPQSIRASLVLGETSQSFVVSQIYQAGMKEKKFSRTVPGTWLRSELKKDHNVYLGPDINEECIQALFEHGAMRSEAIQVYHSYKSRKKDLEPEFLKRKDAAISQLQLEWPRLKKHAELLVRKRFSDIYNQQVKAKILSVSVQRDFRRFADALTVEYLIRRCSEAPKARIALDRYREQSVPRMIDHQEFKTLRDKFIDAAKSPHESIPITEEEAQTVTDSVASPDESPVRPRQKATSRYGTVKRLVSWGSSAASVVTSAASTVTSAASSAASAMTSVLSSSRSSPDRPKSTRSSFGRDDVGFLHALEQYNSQPVSSEVVQAIKAAAAHWIESRIWDTSDDLAGTIQRVLESLSAQETLRVYCEEQSSALMKDLRQALIPYPSQ
ncbi:hypothetical protein FS837_010773 [Tulasnella sp. UAMH 9824]|nr:hypothetical protein FS837_010773 [Tulasnella sp. UAMH 9824]